MRQVAFLSSYFSLVMITTKICYRATLWRADRTGIVKLLDFSLSLSTRRMRCSAEFSSASALMREKFLTNRVRLRMQFVVLWNRLSSLFTFCSTLDYGGLLDSFLFRLYVSYYWAAVLDVAPEPVSVAAFWLAVQRVFKPSWLTFSKKFVDETGRIVSSVCFIL